MARGDRIRILRTEHNLTMEELGIKVGVGKATIKKYENGTINNIPSDKIELLAQALETTPEYIMGWDDNPTEQQKPEELQAAVPRTIQARIVSFGMDSLPESEREKILSVLQVMYQNNPDLFKRSENDEPGL